MRKINRIIITPIYQLDPNQPLAIYEFKTGFIKGLSYNKYDNYWQRVIHLYGYKAVMMAAAFVLTHEIGHAAYQDANEDKANNFMMREVEKFFGRPLFWPENISSFLDLVEMIKLENLTEGVEK